MALDPDSYTKVFFLFFFSFWVMGIRILLVFTEKIREGERGCVSEVASRVETMVVAYLGRDSRNSYGRQRCLLCCVVLWVPFAAIFIENRAGATVFCTTLEDANHIAGH